MTKQYRNHNIRFSMTDEGGMQAWERLHSEEVEQNFKSQNAFVVAAINDYYERHLAKKNDPYLESREKEDAFADRLVQTVEQKLLSHYLPIRYQLIQFFLIVHCRHLLCPYLYKYCYLMFIQYMAFLLPSQELFSYIFIK